MRQDSVATQIKALLTPSWLGVLLGTLIGVVIVAYVLYMTVFVGSQVEMTSRLGFAELSRTAPTTPIEIQSAITVVNESKFAADAAVFVAWAMAGGLVDILISVILRAFQASKEARTKLLFASPGSKPLIIEDMIVSTAVRLGGVAGIFGLGKLLMALLPYLLVWLVSLQHSRDGVGIALAAIVGCLLGMGIVYGMMLLLRLITLRLRVFF